MNEIVVNVQKTISTTIFENSQIKKRLKNLFDENESLIKSRFNEIKEFLTRDEDDEYSKISYDELFEIFKYNFCCCILNEAIGVTFSSSEKTNVIKNIINLLSNEMLKEAIYGRPMIDAFETILANLPSESAFNKTLHGSSMLLLESKFLGRKIFPWQKTEDDKK